jgi:hypothetical protein
MTQNVGKKNTSPQIHRPMKHLELALKGTGNVHLVT